MNQVVDWQEQLDKLIFWAHDKGYHVSFDDEADTCICYLSKLIEINSKPSLLKQVTFLLHECGHALIFENGSKPFNFQKTRGWSPGTNKYKVYTLIEEVEAWKRSWALAQKLKIPISRAKWEREMVLALKAYIHWAAE